MKAYFILWIQAILFFLLNVAIFFFLLEGSRLPHDTIQYAVFFILIITITSACVFGAGVFYLYFLRKGLNSQQFFLISTIFIISFLPNLLLFLRRFQTSIPNTVFLYFTMVFNFLYIETVFLIILSIITINIKYKKDVLLFLLSLGVGAIIVKNAPISFSKSPDFFSVFIGSQWLLTGIGLSLCIIALGLYLINLLHVKVKTDIIISQILFLFGFLVSFHIILEFFSLFSMFIFSLIMMVCLFGYLRGVFVHTL